MKNNLADSLSIQQYHEGLLDPREMHELEKKALEDPFLADALEGFGYAEVPGEHLSLLQRQLHERIVHAQENKKVLDSSWQRLSVAAAAAVLFITSGILFWMNTNQPEPGDTGAERRVEVSLAPDSIAEASAPSQANPGSPREPSVSAGDSQEVTKGRTVPKVSSESAVPEGGWNALSNYLLLNVNTVSEIPAGAKMVFDATLADGKLTNVRIRRAISDEHDTALLTLLRNGPRWKPVLRHNNKVLITIEY